MVTQDMIHHVEAQKENFQKERHRMVETQLKARDIFDEAILKAMKTVPRHLFVHSSYRDFAYADGALPIGHKQTISQPFIVAFIAQAARLTPHSKVLDIGTGCGYQAAVLSRLCKNVFTIEIVKPLAIQAQKTLKKLHYENISIREGDGSNGWPEEAPFDAIVVAAASPRVPEALLDQLRTGGTLIIPVGEAPNQVLMRYTKKPTSVTEERLLPVTFVPMIGEIRE